MFQEERLSKIEEMVKQKNFCSISELCTIFNISRATARRDLKILEGRNLLSLTHGGAKAFAGGTTQEPPYLVKKNINHEEKIRIAQMACSLIKTGETIIIDSGTTAFEMANIIQTMKNNITIATNDIQVACRLANTQSVDLTVLGGSIRKNYYSTHGFLAQFALEHIYADKAFIGVDAVELKKGFMVTNMEEIIIKKLIMKASKEKIVVCDHSKFESVAFVHLCSINEVNMIITGKELDKEIYSHFIDAGINIVLV